MVSSDKEVHAHDLLSIQLQDQIKKEQKKSLVYFDVGKDDQFEMMYKYFETLKNYQFNIDDLLKRLNDYQEIHNYAQSVLMNSQRLSVITQEVSTLKNRSTDLT